MTPSLLALGANALMDGSRALTALLNVLVRLFSRYLANVNNIDINECAYPNECNSLTEYCDNYDDGYKCVCRENYTFSNGRCVPLIPCKDSCPDYSICVLDRNNKSSCKCIDHYSWVDSNKTCSIVACKNTNCGEGGKCVVVQNRNQSLESK